MAKKKEQFNSSEVNLTDSLESILMESLKEEGIFTIEDDNALRLPLTDKIMNNLVFGGEGFPFGAFMLFTGHPGSFKTTFAISIASQLKKQYKEKVTIIYLDAEGSVTSSRLAQLGLPNVKPGTSLTIEKVNAIVNAIAKQKETKKEFKDTHFLIIWDSIASTPTESELLAEDITKTIGLKARLLSAFLPRWVNGIFMKYNITMIAINQLRDKVSINPMMSPTTVLKNLSYDKTLPGGNGPLYQANVLMEHKVKQTFDEASSPYGIRASLVEIKSVKNKYYPDNIKLNFVFSPIYGYNDVFTQFELLKQNKKINAGGGGYWTFTSIDTDEKFRLKDLTNKLTNPEFKEIWNQVLDETIKEMDAIIRKGGLIEDIEENENKNDENNIIEDDNDLT